MKLFRACVVAAAVLGAPLLGAGTAQAATLPPPGLTQLTQGLTQCLASIPCKAVLGRALTSCLASPACSAELATFLKDNLAVAMILHDAFPFVPCETCKPKCMC